MRHLRTSKYIRRSAWVLALISLISVIARVWVGICCVTGNWAHTFGSVAVGTRYGALQLVTADAPLAGDGNLWQVGSARLLLALPGRVIPTHEKAMMTISTGSATTTINIHAYYIPLLFVTIVTLVLAILGFWMSRARPQPGCCRKCGYDLRGNTSGRCPECGAEASGLLAILRGWSRRVRENWRIGWTVRAAS